MIKKKLLILIMLISVFGDLHAGESSQYILTKIGLAMPENSYKETNINFSNWEFDQGVNVSIALGQSIEQFRFEGEIALREFKALKRTFDGGFENLTGDQTQTSFMINGYWLAVTKGNIVPILGAGVGLTKVSWNRVDLGGTISAIDDSDTVVTFKLSAGIEYQLTDKATLQLAFTTLFMDDVELISADGEVGIMNNQNVNIIDFGLKYTF